MFVANEKDMLATAFDHPEVKNAAMKAVVGAEQGWEDYVMRIVELDPEGYSPRHTHDWPHINYIIEGEGNLHIEGRDTPLETGSVAYVPAGSLHQYQNKGATKFRFICIVPKEGHQ